jgi:ATP adenylyltransferase
MEHLFTPWRRAYVTGLEREPPGCVLCRALDGAAETDSLVVHVAGLNFVVMNLYPYTSGHVMIAPRRHVGRLAQATPEELAEMMQLARRLESLFESLYRPEGFNLGMNVGRPAGAGVADHIHLHVIPRWNGDTSFITVVGGTRVIPEDPLEACARLRAHFK